MMISIIMPAYNAEATIDQAVTSVINQSYRKWELIIVDDGSADNTWEKIKRWEAQDARVRGFSQASSGKPSIARNHGLKKAIGDLISFLDADDYYHYERLAMCINYFKSNSGVDVWFSDFATFDNKGEIVTQRYLNEKGLTKHHALPEKCSLRQDYEWTYNASFYEFMCLQSTSIHTITIAVKKHLLSKVGFFDESMTIGEDLDLWFRLVSNSSVGFTDRALSYYRLNPESITKDSEKLLLGTYNTHHSNFRRAASLIDKSALLQYKLKVSSMAEQIGYYYRTKGNVRKSMQYYGKALRLNNSISNIFNFIKSPVFAIFKS
jgi:glycosyltransferase involved in cell wall biosynthesis